MCSGGQLELTCTTVGRFQEWDFHISKNTTDTTINSGRLVSNQSGLIDSYMTDSIIFNISRVSLPGSIPLVSKLVITVTNSSINGTEMTCVYVQMSSQTCVNDYYNNYIQCHRYSGL